MGLYDLPEFEKLKIKGSKFQMPGFLKSRIFWFIVSTVFISSFFGFLAGLISGGYFFVEVRDRLSEFNIEMPIVERNIEKEYIPQTMTNCRL